MARKSEWMINVRPVLIEQAVEKVRVFQLDYSVCVGKAIFVTKG